MYKIIGADQREYGPVTADEIRLWIAEGRANGQTPVQAQGSTDWKPLGMFPEFAAALGSSHAAPIPPPAVVDYATLPADVRERDYDLDIGHCIGRAWELLKANFWPVVGITLLVMIVIGVTNQIIGLISRVSINNMTTAHEFTVEGGLLIVLSTMLQMPVQSVMMGGLYRYYLKLIRGQDAGLNDAFSVFADGLPQLALLGLVKGILVIVGCAACLVPGIYLAIAWAFADALVADKRIGFWEAMELSRQIVTKHWFVVFALLIVVGLLGMAGALACCIGVLVTSPLSALAMMYAYEDIFGHRAR